MGKATITILGSGTCVPSVRRSSPSVLIEIGDAKILADAGAGTIRQLLLAGLDISEITHVFFSHLHPDHTGEFVSFLFATKYPEIYPGRRPFVVAGGTGIKEFYDGLRRVYGQWIELEPDMMRIVEVNTARSDHLHFDSFDVYTLPLLHTKSSVGLRFVTHDNISIVYSGDTAVCENAITLAQDADVFICEAALPDELEVSGHLTPSSAGEIATQANVRHLVLTHFYPACETVDMASQCRKTYGGALVLARDLMRIEVDPSGITVKCGE